MSNGVEKEFRFVFENMSFRDTLTAYLMTHAQDPFCKQVENQGDNAADSANSRSFEITVPLPEIAKRLDSSIADATVRECMIVSGSGMTSTACGRLPVARFAAMSTYKEEEMNSGEKQTTVNVRVKTEYNSDAADLLKGIMDAFIENHILSYLHRIEDSHRVLQNSSSTF